MFRWSSLALAALFGVGAFWILDDIRRDIKATTASIRRELDGTGPKIAHSLDTTNQYLPGILRNSEKSSAMLVGLATSPNQIADGISRSNWITGHITDPALSAYTTGLLRSIGTSGGTITNFTDPLLQHEQEISAKLWTTLVWPEAQMLIFTKASRNEILKELTRDSREKLKIKMPDGATMFLIDWAKKNYKE